MHGSGSSENGKGGGSRRLQVRTASLRGEEANTTMRMNHTARLIELLQLYWINSIQLPTNMSLRGSDRMNKRGVIRARA
jgi:hypothetical protein